MTQENTVVDTKEQALVDTAQLQFEGLLDFAEALGMEFNGKSFIRHTKNRLLSTVTVISFRNMVRIYQAAAPGEATFIPNWSACGKYSFFILNQYSDGSTPFNLVPFYTKDVVQAYQDKVYKKVKIQIIRNGALVVLSHKLEFIDPAYGEEFQAMVDELVKKVESEKQAEVNA